MKRAATSLCLAVALLLIVAPTGARAQASTAPQDPVTFARMLKADPRTAREIDLGDGLAGLAFAIPRGNDAQMTAPRGAAGRKTAFPYIAYTSISKPSIGGGIDAFDVTPLTFAKYYYVLIVANLGSSSITGKVTFKIGGPVRRTRTFRSVNIPGSTLIALFFQDSPLNRIGNYSLKVSFSGIGAAKSRFCAGC